MALDRNEVISLAREFDRLPLGRTESKDRRGEIIRTIQDGEKWQDRLNFITFWTYLDTPTAQSIFLSILKSEAERAQQEDVSVSDPA